MNLNLNLNFGVYNATFSNISAISWRSVLVVEEAGVPGENIKLCVDLFAFFFLFFKVIVD
jgi:hypothetical protein